MPNLPVNDWVDQTAKAPWQDRYALKDWQARMTQLSPEEEAKFKQWAVQSNVPDTPDYDMRAFWLSQGQTAVNPTDGQPHYPDTFKTPLHQSFSNESMFADPQMNPPPLAGMREVSSSPPAV